jgi:predicted N-acyltransferase
MPKVGIEVYDAISELPRAAWDALLDEQSTPFMRHAWLEALESSGCAQPRAGWTPKHLTLWKAGKLVAAAPAYLKSDSDGDFSRDWDWAALASRAGRRFYPKLVITVPFTPVTGRRLLVASGEDRTQSVAELVRGAMELAKEERCGAVEVLYCQPSELDELGNAGLERRVDFQYHWHNAKYGNVGDFLARFNSKHRNMLKREMAAPAKQGIAIRTVRADEIRQEPQKWAKIAHTLHRATVDKLMWGRRWLNQRFYERIFADMPEHLELVEATHGKKVIAGAFNVASNERLYGRYWGCLEEHPFLHFNVCYYHSIQECIARGTSVFEGGAGGEHKVARGFEPSPTYGAHAFLDQKLDQALRQYLKREWTERMDSLERWQAESPLFKRASTHGVPS